MTKEMENSKEYNEFGELIFEGSFLDGEKNGKGKIYKNNKLFLEENYKNGEIN